MRKYGFCFAIIFLSLSVRTNCQIGHGGLPIGLQRTLKKTPVVIEMLPFDSLKTKKETDSIQKSTKFKKYFFAKNYKVNISPANSGAWEVLTGNLRYWSVTIKSKSARAIGLVFINYKLKKDEKLFVYNKNEILGAFTSDNNLPSLILPVQPIIGDEATVEFTTPHDENNRGTFTIETVAHVYEKLSGAGACEVNINCPEGSNWQKEKRSVCKMVIYSQNYSVYCSGALINNTALDSKPLFFTAHHCIYQDSANLPARTVFYFNYESLTCNGTDGNQNQNFSRFGSKINLVWKRFYIARALFAPADVV